MSVIYRERTRAKLERQQAFTEKRPAVKAPTERMVNEARTRWERTGTKKARERFIDLQTAYNLAQLAVVYQPKKA